MLVFERKSAAVTATELQLLPTLNLSDPARYLPNVSVGKNWIITEQYLTILIIYYYEVISSQISI